MSRTVDRATPDKRAISRTGRQPSRYIRITSRSARIFALLVGISFSRLLNSPEDGLNDQARHHREGGRELIGMVGGISSESRAGIPRNGGRDQFGIRTREVMMTDPGQESDGIPVEESPVGYRNPPRHSRFRPGQSGNPRGRPKGRRNIASQLEDVLSQRVTVTINGKRKRVRTDMAMLLRLREKALGGDFKALKLVLALRADHQPESEGGVDPFELAAEDAAILEGMRILLSTGADDDGR